MSVAVVLIWAAVSLFRLLRGDNEGFERALLLAVAFEVMALVSR